MKACVSALLLVLCSLATLAQAPSEWHDDFVDQLAGAWKIEGQVLGREAHHVLQAEWVLNHQFLRLHERTAAGAPTSERRYDAIWFLGYDSVSERYVLHLMDIFGARYSETLGYGVRDSNSIRFVFEYPDGPFHTTYHWLPETGSWQWLLEEKNTDGKWITFADFKLTRVLPKP
jgi:hypothetical protein